MNREVTQEQILRDVFRLLHRQRWVIIVTTLVAVGAAVIYSVVKSPEYKAKSQLQFVGQSQYLSNIGAAVPFTGIDPAKEAAQDAERVTSPSVISAVATDVTTDLSPKQLKDSVETAVDPDSNLVSLKVTASSAKLAADLANAFAAETKKVITVNQRRLVLNQAKRLENSVAHEKNAILKSTAEQDAARLRSVAQVATPVEIASSATPPGSPSSPKPARDIGLALVLGLIFGTLLAFLRDSLDRRLSDPHDVQLELQIPMLGYVEADSLGGVGFARNGTSGNASDHSLEPFRILRSNVEFLSPDRPPKTLAVTSPVAEEGKSTVAAGLATAAALAGKRVLLVECDLRRPVFAERFNIEAQPGLTDWATGHAKPGDVIRQVPLQYMNGLGPGDPAAEEEKEEASKHSLTVVPSGTYSPMPAELLASQKFKELLGEVEEGYDLVVIDCAPLLPVGDALAVLQHVDAALLCIRLDQTTRDQAHAAKAAIQHLPARPVGLVLTGVRPGREGYYYGYYSSTAAPPPAIVVQPPSSG
jgi:Mrp family chromosome partitioning ATPase/capsular polysaccharide biosynthesis protein